jgi:cytochrome c6
MFKTMTIASFAAAVTVCLLCGCSKESPQTTGAVRPAAPVPSKQSTEIQTGEALFRQFCFNCHPDGGNISDPEKSLHGAALSRNRISKPEDIVKIMRNPMARMLPFDEKILSNKDARTIAEYVLSVFK